MERILLRNGIPEPMPRIEGTYLYQTLHVRGRRPLWLDRHTELLARNIQELFGLRWAPDLRRLEAEIAALLDANRHPVAGSSFVRMVFRILGLLREYDAKSKGMNAGGAPDGELLRELLLKIFLQ